MKGAIPRTRNSQSPSGGLTLAEVLVTIMIFSIIVSALYEVTSVALASWKARSEGDKLSSEGQWALEEMLRHVRGTNLVLLPLKDSIPRNVLAVAEMILDTNQDGFLDADNDKDGKVNEDWPSDITADGAAGIVGIDDNNDTVVDNGFSQDDDEDGSADEDPINGVDNDADGAVDEDPAGTGIDEDGDGSTDEDPIEPVVFYLDTATNRLIERLPNYGTASFSDFIEAPIVSNVKTFTVNRLTKKSGVLLSLTLALESPGGNTVTLQTQVLARKYP